MQVTPRRNGLIKHVRPTWSSWNPTFQQRKIPILASPAAVFLAKAQPFDIADVSSRADRAHPGETIHRWRRSYGGPQAGRIPKCADINLIRGAAAHQRGYGSQEAAAAGGWGGVSSFYPLHLSQSSFEKKHRWSGLEWVSRTGERRKMTRKREEAAETLGVEASWI